MARARRSPVHLARTLAVASSLCATAVAAEIALPGSQCSHVRVLQAADLAQVHADYREQLKTPTAVQLRTLSRATNLLSPLLCQAVQRVAFIDLSDEPEVYGWSMAHEAQDLVYLNSSRAALWSSQRLEGSPTARALAAQNLVHEAAHAAVRLLQSQQPGDPSGTEWAGVGLKELRARPQGSQWRDPAIREARGAIDAPGLDSGLIRAWVDLHESFRARGLAGRYYGDAWNAPEAADRDYPADGFTSAYGGQTPIEDMAEMTAWAVVRPLFVAGAQAAYGGLACTALRGHREAVPDSLAAVETKLRLLGRLGFIDEQDYLQCTGVVMRGASPLDDRPVPN